MVPAVQNIPYRELTLERKLGEGGFGVVYKGTWKGREVAVKVLKVQALNADLREEFDKEAALMTHLDHTNIVKYLGRCEEPDHLALVMEFCAKGSLDRWLKEGEASSWPLREKVGVGVAQGVAYLHSKKLQHRDLKSLNVLLTRDMDARVADFGLSKIKRYTDTTTVVTKGTPLWMAPELIEGSSSHTFSSDVYALGVVLWEITARKFPYENAPNGQIALLWIAQGKKETVPTDTPPYLKEMILECWQKLGDRPSAEHVAKQLASKGGTESPLAAPSAPIASSSSSKPAAPTLPLALPTLAFGATAWSTYFGDVGTEPPLPSNIHEILNAPCPYWPGKKVSETHMLVLIPEKVNGRPLTLNILGELVKTPKKGNAGNYNEDNFFHTYGDTPAPASHWILMTRDVIPGSRSKPFTAQKALLKGGDTVPKLLDATTAIFMQNASGGKHGYVRDPWTFTRCEEPYNASQMVVGGFAPPPGGLVVDYNDFDLEHCGLAAFRLF